MCIEVSPVEVHTVVVERVQQHITRLDELTRVVRRHPAVPDEYLVPGVNVDLAGTGPALEDPGVRVVDGASPVADTVEAEYRVRLGAQPTEKSQHRGGRVVHPSVRSADTRSGMKTGSPGWSSPRSQEMPSSSNREDGWPELCGWHGSRTTSSPSAGIGKGPLPGSQPTGRSWRRNTPPGNSARSAATTSGRGGPKIWFAYQVTTSDGTRKSLHGQSGPDSTGRTLISTSGRPPRLAHKRPRVAPGW